jgi:hypothetical protein
MMMRTVYLDASSLGEACEEMTPACDGMICAQGSATQSAYAGVMCVAICARACH